MDDNRVSEGTRRRTEPTGVPHTARLFVQGVNGTEEGASEGSQCGTAGENTFKDIKKTLI